MKPLQVGIISAGKIAQDAHMPWYDNDPRTQLRAVSSRTAETAQRAADKFGIAHVYTSAEEMLAKENLDVVSVCSPNALHADHVIRALQAGCHVLCEKPPAMNEAEALRMEQAAKEAGKHLLYGFHFRHRCETTVLKRAIDAGELGEIYHMNVQAMRRRGIPGWGVFTDKNLQGGGPLIDVGVHMLDLAINLSGFPEPVEASAVTHQRLGKKPGVGLFGEWDPHTFSVEDLASGMIRFENGASLVLETSYAANIETDEHLNVSLLGDKGGADFHPFALYKEEYGALFDRIPRFIEQTGPDDPYQAQITHFLNVIDGKSKPIIQPHEGRYIQKILDALYESAEKNRAVTC
ncbi:Gfo/Idh/MocA family protein [Salisediminibacterium halotolerans]|uniref:Gfo/Idh/MocA family protein n=1 Tax=Salisediminibacterium halotolerans TaxID=517425 RepID=UPI000EB1E7F2|nr:Gfo/Idh/MocA family oxidoreductase [Salisediminibacterium halotolerans]RLJ75436.1 putative dehydrogenase [Actinophytocola xinjiangensis]RPE89289.1 putative dehydrogenase [Salisediminibacterium halotolerans]TWG36049.1 putative dehydrogenase [Salisediminibacterium halotolerans]GEL07506.1 oxidoreductase [Salisediminibacterium halotolerans]